MAMTVVTELDALKVGEEKEGEQHTQSVTSLDLKLLMEHNRLNKNGTNMNRFTNYH